MSSFWLGDWLCGFCFRKGTDSYSKGFSSGLVYGSRRIRDIYDWNKTTKIVHLLLCVCLVLRWGSVETLWIPPTVMLSTVDLWASLSGCTNKWDNEGFAQTDKTEPAWKTKQMVIYNKAVLWLKTQNLRSHFETENSKTYWLEPPVADWSKNEHCSAFLQSITIKSSHTERH